MRPAADRLADDLGPYLGRGGGRLGRGLRIGRLGTPGGEGDGGKQAEGEHGHPGGDLMA